MPEVMSAEGAPTPGIRQRSRYGPTNRSSAGSTKTATATIIPTTTAPAVPSQPIAAMPDAHRPSSAMTTVPPARNTERPAVLIALAVASSREEPRHRFFLHEVNQTRRGGLVDLGGLFVVLDDDAGDGTAFGDGALGLVWRRDAVNFAQLNQLAAECFDLRLRRPVIEAASRLYDHRYRVPGVRREAIAQRIEERRRLGARDAKRGAVFAGRERPEDGQRHENGHRAGQHQPRMAVCEARPALEHEGGATQLSYISRLVETCLESRRLARSNSVSIQRPSSRVPRTRRPRPGLRAAASSRHLSLSRKPRRTAASGSVARSRHRCRRSGGPWRRSS